MQNNLSKRSNKRNKYLTNNESSNAHNDLNTKKCNKNIKETKAVSDKPITLSNTAGRIFF